jgi:hypothetical protein
MVVRKIKDGIINNRMLSESLKNADLQWATIQSLEAHIGASMTNEQKRNFKRMLEADALRKDYPADFNGYTQGYVAMLRSDKDLSLNIPVHINKTDWYNLLVGFDIIELTKRKGRTVKTMRILSEKYKEPPKTLGDVMEFIFAYTVGNTARMNNSIVFPYGMNRPKIEEEQVYGTGEGNEVTGRKMLYKAIVVGTGPIRMRQAMMHTEGSVSALPMSEVPGFLM